MERQSKGERGREGKREGREGKREGGRQDVRRAVEFRVEGLARVETRIRI